MTEYEAVVRVIAGHIEALEWERDQLRDERRDIRDDPEMGRDCDEYKDVMSELHDVRQQLAALYHLCDDLEERVRELLQADAMGQL